MRRFIIVAAACAMVTGRLLAETPAVGWRGDGRGVFPDAAFPAGAKLALKEIWRTPMADFSTGSPVAVADRVLVRCDPDYLICLSLADGKEVWRAETDIFELEPDAKVRDDLKARMKRSWRWRSAVKNKKPDLEKLSPDDRAACERAIADIRFIEQRGISISKWPEEGFSASTPVSDGQHIYVKSGTGALTCLDTDGKRVWVAVYQKPERGLDELVAGGDRAGSGGFESLLFFPPRPEGAPPAPDPDRHLKGYNDIAVFRNDWYDARALGAFIKGGDNALNHNHCDLGSFMIDAMRVRWAVDLGTEAYGMQMRVGQGGAPAEVRFGGRYWAVFRRGAHGHNTLLINGSGQHQGAFAPIVAFRGNCDDAFAVVDLTVPYRVDARAVRRGLRLVNGRRAVLVQDEIAPRHLCDVVWGMNTGASIDLGGARADLAQDGRRLRATILSPAGAAFGIESAQPEPPQSPNPGISRLVIRLRDRCEPLCIAVLLEPLWDAQAAGVLPALVPLERWPDG